MLHVHWTSVLSDLIIFQTWAQLLATAMAAAAAARSALGRR